MKPEAQRIAIAKACGWEREPALKGDTGEWYHPEVGEGELNIVPDYLNDLNAINKAEILLTTQQKQDYVRTLCAVMGGWDSMPDFTTTFASAAKRAEAFLKAIGKWEP